MSETNNGASYETAIIMNCKYSDLVIQEYHWITEKYGDWDFKLQRVSFKEDKVFDIFTIISIDSSKVDIFFDITKPYNKKYKKVK